MYGSGSHIWISRAGDISHLGQHTSHTHKNQWSCLEEYPPPLTRIPHCFGRSARGYCEWVPGGCVWRELQGRVQSCTALQPVCDCGQWRGLLCGPCTVLTAARVRESCQSAPGGSSLGAYLAHKVYHPLTQARIFKITAALFQNIRHCRRDWALEGSTRQGVPQVSLGAVGCSWGLHSAPTLNLG